MESPSVFSIPEWRCSVEHVGFTVCVSVCVCVCVCVCVYLPPPLNPLQWEGGIRDLPSSAQESAATQDWWHPPEETKDLPPARTGLWDLIDSSLNKHHWYVSHGMFHPQLRRGGCSEQLHPYCHCTLTVKRHSGYIQTRQGKILNRLYQGGAFWGGGFHRYFVMTCDIIGKIFIYFLPVLAESTELMAYKM